MKEQEHDQDIFADTGRNMPENDSDEVTLVLMANLGGSRREWTEVASRLGSRFRCIGIDLPGFGGSSEVKGYSVVEMAEYVIDLLKQLRIGRLLLVGHSMSGKVAMVIASRLTHDSGQPLSLRGIILVTPSPLSPEPMREKKRMEMIEALGKPGRGSRGHAEKYIRDNAKAQLPENVEERAVQDVLRMNGAAWTAWLEHGSKEDWSKRISSLAVPTLVIAGAEDKELGPDAQRRLVLPFLERGRLEVLDGAAHLLPSECPDQVARLISGFAAGLFVNDESLERMHIGAISSPSLAPEYAALIASDRVSAPTRHALMSRLNAGIRVPQVLSTLEFATLQAVASRVLPAADQSLDLAGALDGRLAQGNGKGWRYASLPDASSAYHAALDALSRIAMREYDKSFGELSAAKQDSLLTSAAEGELEPTPREDSVKSDAALTAAQMRRWFEDCRADLTEIYMSHPQTLSEIGFSGIADGADSTSLSGFVQLGLGATESWEPSSRERQS